SNAAIPGATISIRDERTGLERETTTNEEGAYVVLQLKPSVYTITVKSSGFEAKTTAGVVVAVGQSRNLDFIVNAAGKNESITVSDTAVVETSSARIGVNVTPTEVKNLPLNGRQVSQ